MIEIFSAELYNNYNMSKYSYNIPFHKMHVLDPFLHKRRPIFGLSYDLKRFSREFESFELIYGTQKHDLPNFKVCFFNLWAAILLPKFLISLTKI